MKIAGIEIGGFYVGNQYVDHPTREQIAALCGEPQLNPNEARFLIAYAALMAQQAAKPAPKPRRRK